MDDVLNAGMDSEKQSAIELSQRLALVGIHGKPPSDEDKLIEWTGKEARKMLPLAIANLKDRLMNGNSKERETAETRVLEMNGVAKKEAQVGGNATIILNLGKTDEIPWLKGITPIDVKVTKKGEE